MGRAGMGTPVCAHGGLSVDTAAGGGGISEPSALLSIRMKSRNMMTFPAGMHGCAVTEAASHLLTQPQRTVPAGLPEPGGGFT